MYTYTSAFIYAYIYASACQCLRENACKRGWFFSLSLSIDLSLSRALSPSH